jgi:hypothetical protein
MFVGGGVGGVELPTTEVALGSNEKAATAALKPSAALARAILWVDEAIMENTLGPFLSR